MIKAFIKQDITILWVCLKIGQWESHLLDVSNYSENKTSSCLIVQSEDFRDLHLNLFHFLPVFSYFGYLEVLDLKENVSQEKLWKTKERWMSVLPNSSIWVLSVFHCFELRYNFENCRNLIIQMIG